MSVSRFKRKQLYVQSSSIHGLGVFADEVIEEGEVIEECSMIEAEKTCLLQNYLFKIPGSNSYWIILGNGCLYNHASLPNSITYIDEEDQIAKFVASRRIQEDEEIFIAYGEKWFHVRRLKIKDSPVARRHQRLKFLAIVSRFIAALSITLLIVTIRAKFF